MDIHKPKPWHSFREFLKEYLIIVVGVLTALGAEQVVENVHWARRVAETRVQLNAELSADAESGLQWLSRAPCLDAQLAALREALAQARPTGVFSAPPQQYAPSLVVFRTDAWLNARSLQVSDHMSPRAVAQYSSVFFFADELRGNITTLHNLAGELEPLARGLDDMTPSEADEFAVRIGRIQELQTRTALAITLLIAGSDKLGATIHPPAAANPPASETACVRDPAAMLATLRHRGRQTEREFFATLGLKFFGGA
jgi:hypothetical protein